MSRFKNKLEEKLIKRMIQARKKGFVDTEEFLKRLEYQLTSKNA